MARDIEHADEQRLPQDVVDALRNGDRGLAIRMLCDTFAVNYKEAIELVDRYVARDPKLKERLERHRSVLTTERLIPLSLLLALLWFVAIFFLVRK